MSNKSILIDKSFEFAINIVELYKNIIQDKKEYQLSKQLLRAGTSIGANIRESIYAQSKKDFLSKMNIALKEANETEYWLELLIRTSFITLDEGNKLLSESRQLKAMLIATVKTTKNNL